MSAAAAILPDQQTTAQQLLADAQRAWRTKAISERKLAHLRTYRSHTPAMKSEADRALRQLRDADETLKRVLGGAA